MVAILSFYTDPRNQPEVEAALILAVQRFHERSREKWADYMRLDNWHRSVDLRCLFLSCIAEILSHHPSLKIRTVDRVRGVQAHDTIFYHFNNIRNFQPRVGYKSIRDSKAVKNARNGAKQLVLPFADEDEHLSSIPLSHMIHIKVGFKLQDMRISEVAFIIQDDYHIFDVWFLDLSNSHVSSSQSQQTSDFEFKLKDSNDEED